MPSNHFSLLASSIILLVCTACASPPDRRGPPPGDRGKAGANFSGMAARPIGVFLATLDRNQDAIVDTAELDRGITHEWNRLSRSDQASALEFDAWSAVVLGSKNTLPSFITFDHDLDGRFTREDFAKRLRFEFERLDVDNSGTLVRSELLFKISRPPLGSGASGNGQPPRGQGRGRPR